MRAFFIKNGRLLAILLTIGIGIALIVSAMFMLSDYRTEITDRATSIAQYNTVKTVDAVKDELAHYTAKAATVAGNVEEIINYVTLREYLRDLETYEEPGVASVYGIVYARFIKNGQLYTSNADPIEINETEILQHIDALEGKAGYIGSYLDVDDIEGKPMTMVGFYAPSPNAVFCDGVILFYTRQKMETVYSSDDANELAEFSLLCTSDGVIIIGDDTDSAILTRGETLKEGNICDILRKSVGKKEVIEQLQSLLKSESGGTVRTNVGITDYVISVGTDKQHMTDLVIVEMYPVNDLCASGMSFIYTIIAVVIIFTIITIAAIVYLVMHNMAIRRKLFNEETTNASLNCYNRHGFEKHATTIIDRNQTSYFTILILKINHFNFLRDTIGDSEVNNLLRYIKMVLNKSMLEEECYGYHEDGQFLLLLHAKDQQNLIDRLKILSFVISKFKMVKKYNILIKYGIYERELEDKITVSQMIDFANEANNSINKVTKDSANISFNFYDEELRKLRLLNEDMELRMQPALDNGEFQVFYQPKYNLTKNVQDGCEALVRWYDMKQKVYNRPALFMALFEANGFVIKLDKYVFTKVCEYISYSIAHGRTVYPVSVNVSRITAIQPDFLDFYAKTKKKFGISDNLIMIEFTESFAYENYETLSNIVDNLHKNGFKCSIDDFGCGYSSYRILKSLDMDEIKLDRFFMEEGFDYQRDQHIFESIISLAKKLGMKVTQEGVETQEGIDRLRALNCDVVQGYFYSHPLPLSDYITFVQNSRSHNLH